MWPGDSVSVVLTRMEDEAAWMKKLISYTGDPRSSDKPGMMKRIQDSRRRNMTIDI